MVMVGNLVDDVAKKMKNTNQDAEAETKKQDKITLKESLVQKL